MQLITGCKDEAEIANRAIFMMTPESAKRILAARSKLIELQKQEEFTDLAGLDFTAIGKVRYFSDYQLGDENVAVSEKGDLKDLLTVDQRYELGTKEITFVADDFLIYDDDTPAPDDSSPYRWTHLDVLVVEASIFYFRSFSGDYMIESDEINYDVLSRVI